MSLKYKINQNCFDNITEEWQAYFLGLFFADGCIQKDCAMINLMESDSYILEKLNRFIHPDKSLYTRPEKYFNLTGKKTYKSKPQKVLTIYNQHINNKLRSFGLMENKSQKIRFPIGIPENLMHHFIRGYFDGDGCVTEGNHGQTAYIISNYIFCKQIKKYLISKKINSSIVSHGGKVYKLCINNQSHFYKFYNYIYQNDTLFLTRKKNKFDSIIAKFNINKLIGPKNIYSQLRGVSFDKRPNRIKRWSASKRTQNSYKFLGSFLTAEEAHQAFLKYEISLGLMPKELINI